MQQKLFQFFFKQETGVSGKKKPRKATKNHKSHEPQKLRPKLKEYL